MKKNTLYLLMAVFALTLIAGCGGNDGPHYVSTQILSDPAVDGDIAKAVDGTFSINAGDTQSVLAGIDPADGTEYRAFLDFPLTGSGGVPGAASIASAKLDFFIDSITPLPLVSPIPVRIDLVSFAPPLSAASYDRNLRPPLASTTVLPSISTSDIGHHVTVDVTSLMDEAQRRGLSNFQVRILEDLVISPPPGVIEIDDTTGPNAGKLAPLLEVTYF
jgi:hypothetical protein